MTTLFLVAHYDDEFGAWPLIESFRRQGEPMVFAFLAPPRDQRSRTRRRAETAAFLHALGVSREAILEPAEPAGFDGALLGALDAAFAGLRRSVSGLPVSRVVTPAWEGGHVDHDLCAAMGIRLASVLGLAEPVLQFGLYNGENLAGPLFHGARLLHANGPSETVTLSVADWRRFAAAVRCYPSQAGVWSTLWPAMLWTYARHGYRYQTLAPERIRQRPHPGPLLYERRAKADYELVAGGIASLFAEASPGKGSRNR